MPQLILREYVGSFRLDELLAQKESIGQCVRERMKGCEADYCVEILNAGIKDIILAGEIRDIMNTAKLMEENKTLFKLKEMEYLERICDKVGSISLNGGRGVLEQLAELAGIQDGERG